MGTVSSVGGKARGTSWAVSDFSASRSPGQAGEKEWGFNDNGDLLVQVLHVRVHGSHSVNILAYIQRSKIVLISLSR